jgi:hypothetical protein
MDPRSLPQALHLLSPVTACGPSKSIGKQTRAGGPSWQLRDHVVNLVPKGGVPALLTTKLHSVRLHTFDNWASSAGMFELFKMPEIRRRLDELKIRGGMQTEGGATAVSNSPNPSPRPPRPIDINLQDVSVQDVFNAIVRSHGNGTWLYSEIECNGEKTFTIHGWSD